MDGVNSPSLNTCVHMISLDLSKCNSFEDLKAAVVKALEGKEVRIKDSEILEYFNSIGYYGVIKRNVVCCRDVALYSEDDNGEIVYKVLIFEHYVDPGCNDFVYSCFITEL